MATNARTDLIEDIVKLVCLRETVPDRDHREQLSQITRGLRARVQDGVPKHRAAQLLGVTPQALDRHINAGRIPTVRRPGCSRALVERDALIRLLVQIDALKQRGEARPLAKAIGVLEQRGALLTAPRLNQSSAELRYEYEHSTPSNRVRSAASLSRAATTLAARTRARRDL